MEQSSILVILIIAILIMIYSLPFLYINSLQSTLKATSPHNRTIEPYEVWLMFIPIIGLFFHFGHIMKITSTLKNDFEDKEINHNNESVFGANFGLTYCIISIGFFCYFIYSIALLPTYSYSELINLANDNNGTNTPLLIKGAFLLISLISLLIFWSKMSNCRTILLTTSTGDKTYQNSNSIKNDNDNTPIVNQNVTKGSMKRFVIFFLILLLILFLIWFFTQNHPNNNSEIENIITPKK